MTAQLERADTFELLYFMAPYPKRDTAEFQGKYHHLGFNWRAYSLKGDRQALIHALCAALQAKGVDKEERYDFYAQIMYRILDKDESAMERLFDAAFGGGGGNLKEEQLRKVLQNRWSKLEDRSNELCAFMQEMEDIDTDDKEVTGTTIYRFMKFEHTLIDQEQTFIDKLLALINSK